MNEAMNEAQAKKRYFTIQAVRWAGVLMVMLGLAILVGKIDWPPLVGWLIAANGLIDATIIPLMLTRRWRTPKP